MNLKILSQLRMQSTSDDARLDVVFNRYQIVLPAPTCQRKKSTVFVHSDLVENHCFLEDEKRSVPFIVLINSALIKGNRARDLSHKHT